MQALAYYVELIQYEPLHTTTIEPPYTLPSLGGNRTTSAPVDSTTSRLSISTTHRPTTSPVDETTPFHRPGYYAPEIPPSSNDDDETNKSHQESLTTVSTTSLPTKKPSFNGDLPILSISNSPYFEYYLNQRQLLARKSGNTRTLLPLTIDMENKTENQYHSSNVISIQMKKTTTENQFLHQIPAELLQDIANESYELPKRSDLENANEFRKKFDDFYERIRYTNALAGPQFGKKRVPPTRPYVLFLNLYDLLKREAKRLALHDFEVNKERQNNTAEPKIRHFN